MTDETPLKLLAKDAEDIQVLGAILQDAIVPVCDMVYRAGEKNFVMIVQRFKWDSVKCGDVAAPTQEDLASCFERINCALDIEGVESVQFIGVNPNNPAAMLDLLTMNFEGDHLYLIFAGEGKMRLKLGAWRLKLQDFGESWPTTHRPSHAT
jgi:hypothetical protein